MFLFVDLMLVVRTRKNFAHTLSSELKRLSVLL